ncbi:MAG: GNAT family N-acetyltransferase [Candidatus Phaeomarinobacter sp.]
MITHQSVSASGDKYADQVGELVFATGPESYDYIFGSKTTLNRIIDKAWPMTGNMYAHEAASLVMDDDIIAGIEIGYSGAEYYDRRNAMAAASIEAIKSGDVTLEEMRSVSERADKASYLNAWVPPDAYYVLALASAESHRGTGLGKYLLSSAIDKARAGGFRALHLDVLSNNPAVGFYTSMGLTCLSETIAPEPCRDHGVPMEMRMGLTL